MRIQIRYMLAATGLLFASIAVEARGQVNFPFGPSNYAHDFQLFAPVELDLDNAPHVDNYGYFFDYNKLWWSYTGERVTIGNPNVEAVAEVIYQVGLNDEGAPPPPHQIFNTLNDVPPKAGFAFGDRYEIGYRHQGNGWALSILDGPDLHQNEFYGFLPRAIDGGLPPFIDPDYTDGDDIGPGGGPVGEARAFGFGSVPVLFDTPPGYLMGFRDYLQNLAGAQQGTIGGPKLYVGNYGIPVFTEGNEIDDDVLFRRADDLDGDGIWGFVIIVDEDDNIIAFVTDFDDLHTFNIYFDNVTVRSRTHTNGVELMWSHELSNRHYQAKNQNNRLTFFWGARYLKLYDQFRVDAQGSILGASFWDTSFTNQIVGPQVAMRWENQRQRWKLQADVRFMFGYNTADWDQVGLMGEELIPGALNRPLYARPTALSHGLQEQDFAPVGELRLQASYYLTKAAALKAGYTGMFVGNIHRAASSVRYALPDMGYNNAGPQDILVNGFDFGIEFVY